MTDRYFSIPKAAEHFCVSVRTIYAWLDKKYIQSYRRIGNIYVLESNVEAGFELHGPSKMRDGRDSPLGRALPVPDDAEVIE